MGLVVQLMFVFPSLSSSYSLKRLFHRLDFYRNQLNRTVTLMDAPPYTCMRKGIIQRELLHALGLEKSIDFLLKKCSRLGFFHEQSRPDRDEYVSTQWENILNGFTFQLIINEDIFFSL